VLAESGNAIPARRSRVLWRVLCIAALLSVFAFFARDSAPSGPYGYDEADYMYIHSRGFLSHWIDSPSQSLIEFLRAGLGRGLDSGQRTALSEMIRSSDDINFYRHWHGPLYEDWLMGVTARWKDHELSARRTTLFFHIATFLVIYAGCLRLGGPWAAVLCGALYLLSFSNVRTAAAVAPHALYVFCYISALLSAALWIETGRFRYWYGAIVLCALAFCTLEVGAVLIVTLIVAAWFERRRTMAGWSRAEWLRFAALSSGTFLGVVAVIWPAAILKLSFLKAWAFMAYLAIFRRDAWGSDGMFESWAARLRDAPLDWALLAGGVLIGVFWLRREKGGRIFFPFFVYAGLMMAVLLRVASDEPRYISPYLAALQVTAGLSFARAIDLLGRSQRWIAALTLLGAAMAGDYLQFRAHIPKASTAESRRAVLRFVAENHAAPGQLLIPQDVVPIFHYYFPGRRLTSYTDEESLRRFFEEPARSEAGGLVYQTPAAAPPDWMRVPSKAVHHVARDEASGISTFYIDLRPPGSPAIEPHASRLP
jgi:hypothetical protein